MIRNGYTVHIKKNPLNCDLFQSNDFSFKVPVQMRNVIAYCISGKVGDWKNTFTVAQNEAFDAEYDKQMKDCKITVKWT